MFSELGEFAIEAFNPKLLFSDMFGETENEKRVAKMIINGFQWLC